MTGMTALKQITKDAQIKGMAYVKKYICSLVFGVISPYPIVVAVTINLQSKIQSSGRVPSLSPKVNILYPNMTNPKQRYSTTVYLRTIAINFIILPKEFDADWKISSMASPKALQTNIILKKYNPVMKEQLFGIRAQLRFNVRMIWKISKKCFLVISMLTMVNPSYKKKIWSGRLGIGVQMRMQMYEMRTMWIILMYAVKIFSID